MSRFVHLRCRSDNTLFGSTMRVRDICQRAVNLGMPAVALTDRGNMHGALEFRQKAIRKGIKPIIGCELQVAPGSSVTGGRAAYLLLLARSRTGYQNLIRLVTEAHLRGGSCHLLSRDKALLPGQTEGLIALSGCLDGEVGQALLSGGLELGIQVARELSAVFLDGFYLELQDNGLPGQRYVNTLLIKVARETGLPLVATNDSRHLNPADAEALAALALTDDASSRMGIEGKGLHFRTEREMRDTFHHCLEAVDNAARIAELCDVELLQGSRMVALPQLSEVDDAVQELGRLAQTGLAERLRNASEEDAARYRERLEYELLVIAQTDYADDFLLAWDSMHWANTQDILVGPGWGAGGGSIVAWALGITEIDPLRYELVFELFMNRERVFYPDIFVCVCQNRRQEVLRYLAGRHGEEHVAQVAYFKTIGAKRAVRLAGRLLGMEEREIWPVSALLPEEGEDIQRELSTNDRLMLMLNADVRLERLMTITQVVARLQGQPGLNENDIAIARSTLSDVVPLANGDGGMRVTQYDRRHAELAGLGFLHILGLRVLSVLAETSHMLRLRGVDPPTPFALPLDDPEAFGVLCRGELESIFWQDPLWPWVDDSTSMAECMQRLQPACIEDVAAMLALYRPGPLSEGLTEEYLDRRHREAIYPHPCLERILEPTHGVMVYHDQMLLAAQAIAGYSLEDADLLRRAMGKKHWEEMVAQRQRFRAGAADNGISEMIADALFERLERVAELGRMKAHFLAFAHICYATAYFKAHFPLEFKAANSTTRPDLHSQTGRAGGQHWRSS